MTSPRETTRLSVFDLAPIPPGADPGEPIRAAIELAQLAERLGFRGYWFGEHHLGTGRTGAAPAVLAAILAQETERLHLGSAVTVLPNSNPLAVVEQFGTIAALHPGRVTIGVGRASKYQDDPITPGVTEALRRLRQHPDDRDDRPPVHLERSEYFALQRALLRVEPFEDAEFREQVLELVSLLRHPVAEIDGVELRAAPGYGLDLDVALFGWTAGPSARLAGELGLPYVANAHNHDFPLEDNVRHYREHFRPSAALEQPYVAVSVQALAAETETEAVRLGAPFTKWIHLLSRRGFAVSAERIDEPFVPTSEDERAGLERALGLRHLGTPDQVADALAETARITGADELIVHTFTADSATRLRSYELLGEAWAQRAPVLAEVTAA